MQRRINFSLFSFMSRVRDENYELNLVYDQDLTGRVPRYLGDTNTSGRRQEMCHHTQPIVTIVHPERGTSQSRREWKGSNVICVNFGCWLISGDEETKRAACPEYHDIK